MRRISVKAVLIGGSVDLLLTLVLSLPVYAFVAAKTIPSLTEPQDQVDAIVAAAFSDPAVYLTLILLGCIGSLAGGYAAARSASQDAVLHVAASASVCLMLTIVTLFTDPAGMPVWHLAVLVPLGIALGALGGAWWNARSNERVPVLATPVQAPWLRRLAAVTLYVPASVLVIGWSAGRYVSWTCLREDLCTTTEAAIMATAGTLIVISVPAILIGGLMGFLPGARRKRIGSIAADVPADQASIPT